MSSFRKEFNTYTLEELKDNDFGFTLNDSFVTEDEVKSIFDSIEAGVNKGRIREYQRIDRN